MITVPTGDLVGLISDVLPFASPHKELPDMYSVRIIWDGEQLHAHARDHRHFAMSTWSQDDETDQEQGELFAQWGGGDEPWAITISREDAKKLVDTFKLGSKKYFIPLQLDCDGFSLKVKRDKADALAAITMTILHWGTEFPDLRKVADDNTKPKAVKGIGVSAECLAHLATVRARGELKLAFTGANGWIIATMGDRFTAGIKPAYDKAADTKALLLKDGAGLLIGGGEPA